MKIEVIDFRCKFCNSANVIKYGKFRGIQRYSVSYLKEWIPAKVRKVFEVISVSE